MATADDDAEGHSTRRRHVLGAAAVAVLVGVGVGVIATRDGDTAPAPNGDTDAGSEPSTRSDEPAGSAPADSPSLDNMLLHLPDVPEGARIGDDSYCGGRLGSEGASDSSLALLAASDEAGAPVMTCFSQLESQDGYVHSLVISLPNDALAARAITPDLLADLIAYVGLGCCSEQLPEAFVPVTDLGGDALGATSPNGALALDAWRDGSLVGVVAVYRPDGADPTGDAHRLAVLQRERMLDPVPVPADIDDDHLAGLDAAPFPVWWIGESFAPPGLPVMELDATSFHDGFVDLDYAGIRLEVIDLDAVTHDSQLADILAVADLVFDSPCTVTRTIERADASATLIGRYLPPDSLSPSFSETPAWAEIGADGTCPVEEPNVWSATVEFPDGILVRINAPGCYNCIRAEAPDLPYLGPAGLEAVVVGLRPYDG